MSNSNPHILFINPWIHDFAAYDVWAKPIGLLTLAAILRDHGCRVSYIDCLDRFHPKSLKQNNPNLRDGRGGYLKTEILPPKGLENINRRYSRYGIKPEWFIEDLMSSLKPDLIMLTSLMTYWAYGVTETIDLVKQVFPDVPVILGGIYATLCYDHAKQKSGADLVLKGPGEGIVFDIIKQYLNFSVSLKFDPDDMNTYPYPAFDLQNIINYVPLLTSKGCPFSCNYCASNYLSPTFMKKNTDLIIKEIKYWQGKYNVTNFAFYDDALLINPEDHAHKLFKSIISSKIDIKLHTPNAIHIREISKATADLMYRAGFKTLRLGLETVDFKHRNSIDKKVTEKEFERAVVNLKNAGFETDQIGAYLLIGLPEQTFESIESSVKLVLDRGITPVLTYYSPIPHTKMWERAIKASRYDIASDPVFTNNSIFPCQKEEFSWDKISYLKDLIHSYKLKKEVNA